MTVLETAVDPRSPAHLENRGAMLERLADLESALEAARAGGGEKNVTRHHARGKLLPRERVELLLDQDAPFLELSPVANDTATTEIYTLSLTRFRSRWSPYHLFPARQDLVAGGWVGLSNRIRKVVEG